jgi:hypothetical protein
MDVDSNKADPYVVLRLGMEERRTRYKDDAGGTLVVFNEVLSFSKRLQDNLLRIQVFDKDTHTDDLMGEREVDLNKHELTPGGQSEAPVQFVFWTRVNVSFRYLSSFAKTTKI